MSDYVDPNDFVITRKRKKYKFAKFANASNCFEFEQWHKKAVDVIEIGAGDGLFSVEMARRHPDRSYAALDVKGDRLQKGAYEALKDDIRNVAFIRARADQVDDIFTAGSVKELWLTFSDPFPRKRSSARRMTHPLYLQKYASLLGAFGVLYVKHDDQDFFNWTLEQLVSEKWSIDQLTYDLQESKLADDYKILTAYEKRWLSDGKPTQFVRAHKS